MPWFTINMYLSSHIQSPLMSTTYCQHLCKLCMSLWKNSGIWASQTSLRLLLTFEVVHVIILLPSYAAIQLSRGVLVRAVWALPAITRPATSGKSPGGLMTCIVMKLFWTCYGQFLQGVLKIELTTYLIHVISYIFSTPWFLLDWVVCSSRQRWESCSVARV